jgi:hypothetical protein
MKKYLALMSASIAAAAVLCASPAMARDDVDWSVRVGSSGYPSAVVYGPPRVVYERPRPVYVERQTIVRYGPPYGYREGHRYGHYRGHDQDRWEERYERRERRHHGRHDD